MLQRPKSELTTNPLVRIVGRDDPAAAVLAANATLFADVIQLACSSHTPPDDYTQIDPALQIAPTAQADSAPEPGLGYAGLTPGQRAYFLQWLDDPAAPAPAAFQQLYLAQLEINLFTSAAQALQTRHELRRLSRSPAWCEHIGLARANLLAFWLTQDGAGLAEWLEMTPAPPLLLGVLLGSQAILRAPLRSGQLPRIVESWQIGSALSMSSLWTLRLHTLTTQLGEDPLRHALAQIGADALAPRLWRANHRDLRLLLPQADLRRPLSTLLAEITQLETSAPTPPPEIAPSDHEVAAVSRLDELGWRLILEFGHSRADLFHQAVRLAQRQPDFTQLLDENRTVVYRVAFRKKEMRQFWRLWDYVQSWATTRVYLNGQELEKWQVYPYSQFLR